MVLLDLTTAFDTVDHTILIYRLHDIVGVSGLALKWFRSYLSNRSFSVFANHFMSNSKYMTCGVPQGSVVGPILFTLYILPLGLRIRQFPDVSYRFYAGDIQLYWSSKPNIFKDWPPCLNVWLLLYSGLMKTTYSSQPIKV